MSDTFRDRYVHAQLEGNRSGALGVIAEALDAGTSVADVQLRILQPAQYEIGRLWETNVISIAVEHQATAISQLALAFLYDRLPRTKSNGKRVLVACVEGELHDMGSRVAADFLEMEGFDVRLLGASVPAASLAERVESYRPDLIALSATMTFHLPALKGAIAAVRSTSQRTTPIVVGGGAFVRERGAETGLDVQGFGGDAAELVAEARRLTLSSPA